MDFVAPYLAQSVRWLMPDENVPCDIFLHFRGRYALAVAAGQALNGAILDRFAKARYTHIYLKPEDLTAFLAWTQQRHPGQGGGGASSAKKTDENEVYGNKRAELLSFLSRAVTARQQESSDLERFMRAARESMQKTIESTMLDWYFQQFHEPPDLFQHNGRVAFLLAAFVHRHAALTSRELLDALFASLIHQLEGNPADRSATLVSQQTIATLEKSRRPVPESVISFLRMQDELFSGKGFPAGIKGAAVPESVRLFTLFNHFDRYRLQAAGTRRSRFDQARSRMEERRQDYDPQWWDKFWEFMEKEIEVIA